MARGKKHPDLDKLKQEYLTDPDYPSLRVLSEKYSISWHTLTDRCARERWRDQREEFHDKVASESLQRQLRLAAEDRVKDLQQAKGLKSAVIGDLLTRVRAKQNFQKALDLWNRMSPADKEGEAAPVLSASEIDFSVSDFDKMQRLLLLMVGDPDSRLEISADIQIQITSVVQLVCKIITEEVQDRATRQRVTSRLSEELAALQGTQNDN